MLAFTAVAATVAVAGLALFSVLLHRGVTASVDAVLQARAAPIVAGLRSSGPANGVSPAPPAGSDVPSAARGDEVDSFTVIYRPDGSVFSSEPVVAARILRGSHELVEARSATAYLTVTNGQEPLRMLAVPAQRADGTWVVAVGTSLTPASAAADRALRDLYIGVPVLVVLAGIGAWVLAGASLRPVERMRADADRIGEGDPSGRISIPRNTDELARLATTFNALLDRAERALVRQRKLVADTGHELRTPLAVLRTELELADSPDRTRDDLAEAVAHARREAERLSKLADDMLFLARADSAAPLVNLQEMDLCPVLAQAVRAHRARAETSLVELSLACDGPLPIQGDDAAIRRAVDNLLGNSLAATPSGGRVEVAAHRGGAGVVLEVSDSGPGFPPEFLPHAFERFTLPDSARPSGKHGAGLGLAIVAEVVAAHGGRVEARNVEGGGASVWVTLPATVPGRPTAARAARPAKG